MSTHHGHQHAPGLATARAGERHRRPLAIAVGLTATFLVVEAVAGVLTGSLALLSDAAHMLTDVVGLGMALAAIGVATRHGRGARRHDPPSRHTFGLYRLEILAALANSLLLVGVAAFVVVEAARRLTEEPEVLGVPMLVVAVVGLVVNLTAFALLRRGATESINVKGAYLEVLADTVGSLGVIIAAIAVETMGWVWADPVIGAAIGLWILPRAVRLGRDAVRILLQSAPGDVDLARLRLDLLALPGVVGVHDLHVWTLTSEMESASVHLVTAADADPHGVLDQARALLSERYGIAHGTFQIESEALTGCEELGW